MHPLLVRSLVALALAVFAAAPVPGGAPPPPAPPPTSTALPIVNGVAEHGEPAVGFFFAGGGFCSATLIGCRTALTAAHCLCGDRISGDECRERLALLPGPERWIYFQHAGIAAVAGVEVHPGYEYPLGHDLAVLTLAEPVAGVRPARINRSRRPPHGTPGRVVGFGRAGGAALDAGLKRSGRVTTAACRQVTGETHVCWDFVAPVGAPGADSSTCHGDSGGPLFLDLGAGTVVAGVTSGGEDLCLEPNNPWDADVFVDHPWIAGIAGADLASGAAAAACGDLPPAGEPGGAVHAAAGRLSKGAAAARFTVEVPVGARRLVVGLNGTSIEGDADLYLRHGAPARRSAYDCRSIRSLSLESCVVERPAPGTWHLLADRVRGVVDFQLTATVFAPESSADPPPPSTTWLASPALPGFELQARLGGERTGRTVEAGCIAESLCVEGAVAGRTELVVKVIGPRGNGFLWAQVARFTPARAEVWLRRVATGETRYYDLAAVTDPDGAVPGLQDREAFPAR